MTSVMTTAQAQAINKIWDGPRNQAGPRLWAGLTYGPQVVLRLGGPATAAVIFDGELYTTIGWSKCRVPITSISSQPTATLSYLPAVIAPNTTTPTPPFQVL